MIFELDEALTKYICQMQTALLESSDRTAVAAAVTGLQNTVAAASARMDAMETELEHTADDIEEIKGGS